MKKLPLGIQSFEKIRSAPYLYIDKTQQAFTMAEQGSYFFLSRPRRFGKSLFLDTLKCLFEGRKDLFKGLFVYDKWDWDKTYPVIRIDFSKGLVKTKKELSDKIGAFIRQTARDFNLKILETGTSNAFEELIRKCHDHYDMPVVILIDEYDKPILDNITDNDTALTMRDGLRDLYSVIKGMDPFIRFAFLTGVSKFSKMNLFSGEPVYNPYDILLFFQEGGKFKNYWFETGTPTFLMDMIRTKQYFLPDLENLEVSEQVLNTFDVGNIPIESLMFQTGYLTIKKTGTIFNQVIHTLSYPNFEVKNAFNKYLVGYFTEHRFQPDARLYKTLLEDDFTGLKSQIERLFAAIPFTSHGHLAHYEGFYVSVIYAFLASLGLDLTAEDITGRGRADLTLKFPGHEKIYIFEFKVIEKDPPSGGKNPLTQIREKRYYEKYMGPGKRIFLIGIEFSKEKRNIASFEWEQIVTDV